MLDAGKPGGTSSSSRAALSLCCVCAPSCSPSCWLLPLSTIPRSPASSRDMAVTRARRTELTVVGAVPAPDPNVGPVALLVTATMKRPPQVIAARRTHARSASVRNSADVAATVARYRPRLALLHAIRPFECSCALSPRVTAERVAIICVPRRVRAHRRLWPRCNRLPWRLSPQPRRRQCTSSQAYDLSVVRKPLSLYVRRHVRCTHGRSWTVLQPSSSIFCEVNVTRDRNYRYYMYTDILVRG
ncbi:hypothetical protein EXIGLDRAFT_154112 [Exidia glandulosa HHB12029]|uniref:Uncharacterized protein n=1 Tax=Exidia glandulosa HHB12029 TaxID=1314781 RepID=A0A165QHJ3_EXIGL|nr:hypothetical protein EXIGLDRAFT_154112 [Exidia glandulosa HHB12029]